MNSLEDPQMPSAESKPSLGERVKKAVVWLLNLLTWVWTLRVPLLGMVVLQVLAFRHDVNLIRGAFDVTGQNTMLSISFSIYIFVWAMRMICSLTVRYGPERFGVGKFESLWPMWLRRLKPMEDGPGVFIWSLLGVYPLVVCWQVGNPTTLASRPPQLQWVPESFVPALPWLMMVLGWLLAYVLYAVVVYWQRLGQKAPVTLSSTNESELEPKGEVFDLWLPGKQLKDFYHEASASTMKRVQKWLLQFCIWLLNVFPAEFGQGVLVYNTSNKVVDVRPGVIATMLAGLVGTALFWSFQSLDKGWQVPLPAIFYVVWLLTVLCWHIGFVAFILDRWRMPSVLFFIGGICFIGYLRPTDYTFPVSTTEVELPPAGKILQKQIANKPPAARRIILVAAEGGGIHSGTWVTHVLGKLAQKCSATHKEAEKENPFKDSIILVSGVSGGSYGLMYWLDSYSDDYPFPRWYGPREHAKRDSLSAAIRGLVYNDLWSYVLPKQLLDKDRGTLIQNRWAEKLEMQVPNEASIMDHRQKGLGNIPLSEWAQLVAERKLPAALFNSTSQEAGLPVVFSTSSFSNQPEKEDIREFRNRRVKIPPAPPAPKDPKDKQAPNLKVEWWLDTNITAAARMSSSFPWVLPMARPSGTDDRLTNTQHLADGGYYDNFGMGSLIHWLDSALDDYQKSLTGVSGQPPLEILVVQIWDGPTAEQKAGDTNKTSHGPLFQAAAPLWLLVNERSNSHSVRDSQEYKLLREKWADVAHIGTACFEFPYDDAALSWHLTKEQEEQITRIPLTLDEVEKADEKKPVVTKAKALEQELEQHPGYINKDESVENPEKPAAVVLEARREILKARLKKIEEATEVVKTYMEKGTIPDDQLAEIVKSKVTAPPSTPAPPAVSK